MMIGLSLISNSFVFQFLKGTSVGVPFLYNIFMNKSEIRIIQRSIRKSLPIDILSNKIIDNLIALPEFVRAKNIFTYISFGSEINTFRILNFSAKNIFVPKMIENSMIMVRYDKHSLIKNKYGIWEPKNVTPSFPSNDDIIIIPALACDTSFNRLGYGGGYYDKYLKNTNGVRVVLIPSKLLVTKLPVDIYDQKVDIIVAENKILKNTNSVH